MGVSDARSREKATKAKAGIETLPLEKQQKPRWYGDKNSYIFGRVTIFLVFSKSAKSHKNIMQIAYVILNLLMLSH